MRLILASASPRRAELLRAGGFEFETLPVDVDETARPGESPQAYVRRLAMEKSARALDLVRAAKAGRYVHEPAVRGDAPDVSGRDETPVILAADTAVVVDGEILGKPRGAGQAADMLRRLSGRRHEVMTGISLRAGEHEAGHVEVTEVEFSRLSEADVAWYVRSGEGLDKAGAYAIQGLAARFIPRIEGSYSNVVGLPVATVCELLGRIASSRYSGYSQR